MILKIKRLLLPVHPFLFAVYPVITLLAHNVSQLWIRDTYRSFVLSILLTLVLIGLFRLIFRDWHKAGVISSFAIILLITFGQVYTFLRTVPYIKLILAHYTVLIPVEIVLVGFWGWWVARKSKIVAELEVFFGLFGLISLIFPLYTVLSYYFVPVKAGTVNISSVPGLPQNKERPDIYFIVSDAHARADILSSIYDDDESGFINFLKAKGFYVPMDSHSNYPETELSLASTLNMEYLDTLAQQVGTSSTDLRPLSDRIANSQVRANLASLGYKMVAFDPGWQYTAVTNADIYLADNNVNQKSVFMSGEINPFELLFLHTSFIGPYLTYLQNQTSGISETAIDSPFLAHRDDILFTLAELTKIPAMQGDYFVFAHMIAPHPPFIFGPNGEFRPPAGSYTFQDGDGFPGTKAEYITGYRDQVTYMDKELENTVSLILARSQVPPIIIIEGDHGSRYTMHYNSAADTNMHEIFSNLIAYYLPGQKDPPLYPSITPVNSFRTVFNLYFDGHYALLPDQSYFSTSNQPYLFINVTGRTRTDPLPVIRSK